MDYDELLLKLQRFAGDGAEDAQPVEPGAGDGGDDQTVVTEHSIEEADQELHDIGNQIQKDVDEVNQIIATEITDEAIDQESADYVAETTNTAAEQIGGFTESIGALATFAGSVLEAYRANADQIHNEISEWAGSFRSLLTDLADGARGTQNGEQVAQGSISTEEFASQTSENANTMIGGIVQISAGTRQLAQGAFKQIADTGRYYTSTTGQSPIGAVKTLVSGIASGGGAANTTTGTVVGRIISGGLKAIGSIFGLAKA